MVDDLKLIKNKYGEKMMHFCRKNFSTILEQPGLLYKMLSDIFFPYRYIVDDLVDNDLVFSFVEYIYSKLDNSSNNYHINSDLSPYELLKSVGYNLYKCNTLEELYSFKKYYTSKEMLCSFDDDRLSQAYVYFAVKENVDDIRREDFKEPYREDEYGTSVMSIQISKSSNFVSIKNRYNHTVNNPDATYNNNLDNIVPGLTNSIEKDLGIKINQFEDCEFSIPNYVKTLDNRLYKSNCRCNDIYYCPNNIIIENYIARQYDKEKYILVDDILINLQNKRIEVIDPDNNNGIFNAIKSINKIEVYNNKDNKTININDNIFITVDKNNRMISYVDDSIEYVGDNFLVNNEIIKYISLKNVKFIGDNFLMNNIHLSDINLGNVEIIKDNFLEFNQHLKELYLPNVIVIGSGFLTLNNVMDILYMPNVKYIKDNFMIYNNSLKSLCLPSLEECGSFFMKYNTSVKNIILNELRKTGYFFFWKTSSVSELLIPKLEDLGDNSLVYIDHNDDVLSLKKQKL